MNPFVIDNLKIALTGKKIILGMTGSIAAFKAIEVLRLLRDCGAEVKVVMSESAEKFVSPLTLETLSGNAVVTSMWESGGRGNHHIELARWADLMLIAPATANTLAKMANGIADNVLLTEYLAFDRPVLVVPAMNSKMLEHSATQANLRKLGRSGVNILLGKIGELSCGEFGLGRLAEPEEILERAASTLSLPNGKRMLITNGPTQSRIDSVRYITNFSSGRMGASICWAATMNGWDVTVVSGNVEVPYPAGVNVIYVETAQQMYESVVDEWSSYDVFVGAAAVLDWDVANPSDSKIKKGEDEINIEWNLNPDILKFAGESKTKSQKVLGFAAESENLIRNATQKLHEKSCDAVFANWISDSMGKEDSKGIWIDSQSNAIQFSHGSKAELARAVIDTIESRWIQSKKEYYENPQIYQ